MNHYSDEIIRKLPDMQTHNLPDSQPADFDKPPSEIYSSPQENMGPVAGKSCVHMINCLDVSDSMNHGNKLLKSFQASEMAISQVKVPASEKNVFVSQVFFNHEADIAFSLVEASEAEALTRSASGGTSLNANLRAVDSLLDQASDHEFGLGRELIDQIVVILSDGQSKFNQSLIDKVQSKATVIAIAFGEDADMSVLSKLDSSGKARYASADGNDLQDLFSRIGVMVSQRSQGYEGSEI